MFKNINQHLAGYQTVHLDSCTFILCQADRLLNHELELVGSRGKRASSYRTALRLMAQGQVQVVTEDKGRLIDRAWNATLRALRSLTGMGKTAEIGGDGA